MLLSPELRRKFIIRKARQRAADIMTKEGFKVVGGNPRTYGIEEAQTAISHVDDASIIANLPKGTFGDGTLLQELIQWIKDHQDQIMAVIKIILSLAMLFLDENPTV